MSAERNSPWSTSTRPRRSFKVSVTCSAAAQATAGAITPTVSQVSPKPTGGTGKTQARHAVSPGRTVIVADRKSTRLNSSHRTISYAVFCLKKKKYKTRNYRYSFNINCVCSEVRHTEELTDS